MATRPDAEQEVGLEIKRKWLAGRFCKRPSFADVLRSWNWQIGIYGCGSHKTDQDFSATATLYSPPPSTCWEYWTPSRIAVVQLPGTPNMWPKWIKISNQTNHPQPYCIRQICWNVYIAENTYNPEPDSNTSLAFTCIPCGCGSSLPLHCWPAMPRLAGPLCGVPQRRSTRCRWGLRWPWWAPWMIRGGTGKVHPCWMDRGISWPIRAYPSTKHVQTYPNMCAVHLFEIKLIGWFFCAQCWFGSVWLFQRLNKTTAKKRCKHRDTMR